MSDTDATTLDVRDDRAADPARPDAAGPAAGLVTALLRRIVAAWDAGFVPKALLTEARAILAQPAPDTLDAAWARVEAALPDALAVAFHEAGWCKWSDTGHALAHDDADEDGYRAALAKVLVKALADALEARK